MNKCFKRKGAKDKNQQFAKGKIQIADKKAHLLIFWLQTTEADNG